MTLTSFLQAGVASFAAFFIITLESGGIWLSGRFAAVFTSFQRSVHMPLLAGDDRICRLRFSFCAAIHGEAPSALPKLGNGAEESVLPGGHQLSPMLPACAPGRN